MPQIYNQFNPGRVLAHQAGYRVPEKKVGGAAEGPEELAVWCRNALRIAQQPIANSARRFGLSPQFINHLERGYRPKPETRAKIARLLDWLALRPAQGGTAGSKE